MTVMNIKKHNEDLAQRIQLLNSKADRQLAKEIIELYETKCKECQEDRLGCTVRPSCKDRNVLNLLIEIGVDPVDLPEFCYTQYMEQIKRYILEKKGRTIEDRKIPIKDLLSTLKLSSIRHFTSKFRRIWDKFSSVHEDNIMLVTGDNLLFHFDFARGVVTINPAHMVIDSFALFQLYVRLFSNKFDLKTAISDATENWWMLDISSDGGIVPEVKKSIKALRDRYEAISIDDKNDAMHIQTEVIMTGKKPAFEINDLQNLFNLVSEMKQKKKAKK